MFIDNIFIEQQIKQIEIDDVLWLSLNKKIYDSVNEIIINDFEIDSISKNIFDCFPNIKILDLSSNSIPIVKVDLISPGSFLEVLNLHGNEITKICPGIFSSLTHLRVLNLSSNKIREIKDNAFTYLTNLRELYLQQNRIEELKSNIFMDLKKLEKLDLSSNNLTYICRDTFSGLNNLEILELKCNYIQSVEACSFAHMKNLKKLALKRKITYDEVFWERSLNSHKRGTRTNDLSVFKSNEEMFNGLFNLEDLCCDNRILENFNANAFIQLESLKKIVLCANSKTDFLSYNYLNLDGLNNLEHIELKQFWFYDLTNKPFFKLKKLETLVMHDCYLKNVHHLFDGLENLKELDFCGTVIKNYHGNNIFNNFKNIQVYNIRNFFINYVLGVNFTSSKKIFRYINGIFGSKQLSVQQRFLEYLSVGHILSFDKKQNKLITERMNQLKELDFSDNIINSLEANVFECMGNLEKLTLRNTRLKKLENGCFTNLSYLNHLNLSENQLNYIDSTIFDVDLHNITVLNMNSNNFEMIEDELFVNLCNLKELYLSKNNIKFIGSESFKPLKNLEILDLSNNKLKRLVSDVFYDLTYLKVLKLERNKLKFVDTNLFEKLTSIKVLDLSYNNIEEFSFHNFRHDRHQFLEELNLEGNVLTTIEMKFYSKFKNLKHLSFLANPIKEILDISMVNMMNIEKISIFEENDIYQNEKKFCIRQSINKFNLT